MHRKASWLLAILLLGTLSFVGYQRVHIVRMEAQLGQYWSYEFSMSFFGRLGELSQRVARLGAGSSVGADDREMLTRTIANMQVTMNNTLGDVRKMLRDVPEADNLRGYLRAVDDSARQLPVEATNTPLPSDLQEEFRRHAEMAAVFLSIVKEHFADFQPDGGFTGLQDYWGRNFLTNKQWRAAIAEMDTRADEANYFPR